MIRVAKPLSDCLPEFVAELDVNNNKGPEPTENHQVVINAGERQGSSAMLRLDREVEKLHATGEKRPQTTVDNGLDHDLVRQEGVKYHHQHSKKRAIRSSPATGNVASDGGVERDRDSSSYRYAGPRCHWQEVAHSRHHGRATG